MLGQSVSLRCGNPDKSQNVTRVACRPVSYVLAAVASQVLQQPCFAKSRPFCASCIRLQAPHLQPQPAGSFQVTAKELAGKVNFCLVAAAHRSQPPGVRLALTVIASFGSCTEQLAWAILNAPRQPEQLAAAASTPVVARLTGACADAPSRG